MARLECLKEELEQLTDEAARIELCMGRKYIPQELNDRCTQLRRDIRSMELENERILRIRKNAEEILKAAGLEEGENGWRLETVDESEDEILAVTIETSGTGTVVRLYCTYANTDECHNWHKKELFIITDNDWMINLDSMIDMLRSISADAPDGMKHFRLAQINATIDHIKTAIAATGLKERTHCEKITVS